MAKKNKPDRGPYTEGDYSPKRPPEGPTIVVDEAPTLLVRVVNVDPTCASGAPKGHPVRLASSSGVAQLEVVEGMRLGDVADADLERVRRSGLTRGVVHEIVPEDGWRCVVELLG